MGAVRSSAPITGDLVLKPRNNAAITRFIAQVTDPNSPMFGRYLPAGAFASRFGPAKATVSRAVALLKANGLRVTNVSTDGLLIHFSGTSKAIANAFRTKLENYRVRDGFLGRATTSAVRLPGTIAGSVAAVPGLNDLVRLHPEGIKRAPAKDRGKIRPARTARFTHPAAAPAPCPAATSAANAFGGLTDDQIANAYDAITLYGNADFGAGQHIALYELEPFARFYPPGVPTVGRVDPLAGPAGGGTKVTISGNNLGCPIGVFFGKVPAKSFAKVPGLLDCGATNKVTAVSPKGKKGSRVTVAVETVGSFFSHTGHGRSGARFWYQ